MKPKTVKQLYFSSADKDMLVLPLEDVEKAIYSVRLTIPERNELLKLLGLEAKR